MLTCSMNNPAVDSVMMLLLSFRNSGQTTCVEKNLDSGQGQSQSALWSAAKISDYRKRLGLHRPGEATFSSIRFSALRYFLNSLYGI